MKPQGCEKPRGRTLCEHPYAVHILYVRNRPAAKHDDDIALRLGRHVIRALKASHQTVCNCTDGEQIEHERSHGGSPCRTPQPMFFPEIGSNPHHRKDKDPRRQNPCRPEFQNINHYITCPNRIYYSGSRGI